MQVESWRDRVWRENERNIRKRRKATRLIYPAELTHALALAARLAARRDDAPARCRNRECRAMHLCHARVTPEGDAHCGGGLSEAAQAQAIDMLIFFHMLAGGAPAGKTRSAKDDRGRAKPR